MLSKFDTTTEWQELTGVSDIYGTFTLQNTGNAAFSLYVGTTPENNDSYFIDSNKDGYASGTIYLENTTVEKIWVRSEKPTKISVNKG